MCPSLIKIGSKTAEKNSAQTNRQTDRHYENNGHLAVNQYAIECHSEMTVKIGRHLAFAKVARFGSQWPFLRDIIVLTNASASCN